MHGEGQACFFTEGNEDVRECVPDICAHCVPTVELDMPHNVSIDSLYECSS